jgi:pilus assembly protein CpaB
MASAIAMHGKVLMPSDSRQSPASGSSAKRRQLGPSVVGLIAGAIGIAATLVYMQLFEDRATGGRKIAVLATTKPVTRGTVIAEEMLATREVPQAYVDDRAVRVGDKGRIVGLRAENNIAAGQTVEWTDTIAPSDDVRTLASLVQPGSRALPLRLAQTDPNASSSKTPNQIRPGDFIDVLTVVNGESTVLLQRVLVLSIVPSVTVNVSVPEAQLLSLAMQRGPLSALVRNPEDQRMIDSLPTLNDSALLDPSKRRELRGRRGALGSTAPVHLEEAR